MVRITIAILGILLGGCFEGDKLRRVAEATDRQMGIVPASQRAEPAPRAVTVAPVPEPVAPARPRRGDPAKKARKLYATNCAMCHGATGAADGAASATLRPPARNLRDAAWQASVTDAHLRQVITEGGGSVGLSSLMPPAAYLKRRPAVLDALVDIVRSFSGAPATPGRS